MGVVVPYGKGHLGGAHAAQAQKLLGLADAQGREVFGEGIPRLLGKDRREAAVGHAGRAGHILEHQVGFGEVLGQVGARLGHGGPTLRDMLVAVVQGGAQHFIGRVLAAAVGPFALELPGGVAAGLADDAAGGHQRLHVQVVGGHGAVQVRRAQRGHIFAKDLVQLVRGGVLQPLMQGAQVQVFQGVGGVGGLAHAHDAHARARPRGHQVARVAGRAHREPDIRKAADDLADGQQNPRAAGALQRVEGRAGKGIGAVLGVVLAVAQHQRARAVLGGAHLHDAAAALGQGVERGARHRAGPVRAGKRHVDHRVALGGQVDAQRAHLLDHGVGVAVLHGFVGKEGGEQLFLHKLTA